MAADQARNQRTIAERIGLRWPSVAQRTSRSVLRLPPGSRVRRAYLRRMAQIAFEAWNRGDLELVPHLDADKVETHLVQRSGLPPGFDAVYYGPEGHCRMMEIWNEAWGTWDAEIDEIIEEGRDRVLFISRIHCVGAASGVVLDEWSATRYTFRNGLILRVDAAFDSERDGALEALAADAG